jgi:hypothetical protein
LHLLLFIDIGSDKWLGWCPGERLENPLILASKRFNVIPRVNDCLHYELDLTAGHVVDDIDVNIVRRPTGLKSRISIFVSANVLVILLTISR